MPTATEFSQAVQNLPLTVQDEELRGSEVAVDPLGLPLQYSGNFAVVFQVHCPQTGNDWAVKCFTKEVTGLRDRYRAISEHLQQARLSFMVDFQYQEAGILVGGHRCPLLKMRWVEGETLNAFVAAKLEKPGTLRQLLGLWEKLAQRLHDTRVTHADLQHGNVLLVPARQGEGHRLMLVDYDGMFVPALTGRPSGELGHPAYQHPQRLREGVYSAEVDRFSQLAIYCAVRCLMAGGRKLWDRFDNSDNLLFRQSDFASPGESEALTRLWAARDVDLRALVGHLCLAASKPLNQVPLLGEIVADAKIRPLNSSEEREVLRLLGSGRPAHPARPVPERVAVGSVERAAEDASGTTGTAQAWWSPQALAAFAAALRAALSRMVRSGLDAAQAGAASALKAATPQQGPANADEDWWEEMARVFGVETEHPVDRLITTAVAMALDKGASEIEFLPTATGVRIFSRTKGSTPAQEMRSPPDQLRNRIMNTLKLTTDRSGRIRHSLGGKRLSFHATFRATQYGDAAVLRRSEEGSVSPPPAAGQNKALSSTGHRYCPRCGLALFRKQRSCPKCTATTEMCRKCGKILLGGDIICPKCGTDHAVWKPI